MILAVMGVGGGGGVLQAVISSRLPYNLPLAPFPHHHYHCHCCVGAKGNLCHVDCANRGICDYKTGKCKCFANYYGENCGKRVVGGARVDPLARYRLG